MSTVGATIPAAQGQLSTAEIACGVTIILDSYEPTNRASAACDMGSRRFMAHLLAFKEELQAKQDYLDTLTTEEKQGLDIGAQKDKTTKFMLALNRLERSQDHLHKCKTAVIEAGNVTKRRRQSELMQLMLGADFQHFRTSEDLKARNAENFELEYAYRNMEMAFESAAEDEQNCFAILFGRADDQRLVNRDPNSYLGGNRNRRNSI